MCFNYGVSHHSSCCQQETQPAHGTHQTQPAHGPHQTQSAHGPHQTQPVNPVREDPKNSKKTSKTDKNQQKGSTSATKMNRVGNQKKPENVSRRPSSALLPLGQSKVVSPRTINLKRVNVLLDSGAELSFVDEGLAQENGPRQTEKAKLSLECDPAYYPLKAQTLMNTKLLL
ncbi:hypothetical protein KIN20_016549 [Parelaphostrongylus tenuis]|uniref:Uncharacterized protein n=1 Tax=Parelaphostrongylus tenuis TaxID=148309 RepID=A0AAD5MGM4_PARTN|nr:hypothetical protein KIN20_016549 [Parelaphostrongylus tenuis]